MKRAKIADLKNNLSRYLTHVRDGGEIVVLDRETPVARIVPFAPREAAAAGARRTKGAKDHAAASEEYWTDARLAEMERRGVIIHRGDPAGTEAWLKSHTPAKLPDGSPNISDVFLQMRDEEPW